jgi:hypothetical protein
MRLTEHQGRVGATLWAPASPATDALTATASEGSLLCRLLPSELHDSPDFRHAGRSHSGWQFNFILQPVFAFGAGGRRSWARCISLAESARKAVALDQDV